MGAPGEAGVIVAGDVLGESPIDVLGEVPAPGDTPGEPADKVKGDVAATGDASGDDSGSGVAVGVGGRGMVGPGTSLACLLGLLAGLLGDASDCPGDAVGDLPVAVPGDDVGDEVAVEGEVAEEGDPVTDALGEGDVTPTDTGVLEDAGVTVLPGTDGGDCAEETVGLEPVGAVTGLV